MIKNFFNSITSLFDDEFEARIANPNHVSQGRREQAKIIAANIGTVTLGNILAGFLVVITFINDPQFSKAWFWFIGFLIIVTISMARDAKKINRLNKKKIKSQPKIDAGRFTSDKHQVLTAVTLALLWVLMPVLLFGDAEPGKRFFIVATMLALVGLGAFFLSGFPRAAIIFTLIMTVGLVVVIVGNWHIDLMSSAMLTIAFSLLVIDMLRKNTNFLIDRLEARMALIESNDVISVLLREHDDSGFEWLWETRANGYIKNVSSKFAEVSGRTKENLEGSLLLSLLKSTEIPDSIPSMNFELSVHDAFARGIPFRDIVVCYQHPDGSERWWKLSGRPIIEFDYEGEETICGYRGAALDVTGVKRAEEKLAYLALYDSLTNLPNRASFSDQINRSIEKAKCTNSTAAVMVLDLDKFKHINDTLGHPAGDELLRQVAKRLSVSCKNAAIVARLGGDEFAIIIDDMNVKERIVDFADKVISCFKEPFIISGRCIGINCSIGVAITPVHGENAGDLIKNADLALYRAKTNKQSSFNVFEANMDLQVRERRRLGQELQSAIKNDELYLLYQPLLCAKSDKIIGYEALVRWSNPRCGQVNPERFIPIAEENGTIIELGKWVIHQACREAANWKNSRRVSVNLSPLQFVGIQLESVVALALAESGLAPSRLELEITENSLIVNKETTLNTLRNLRELGITIALDDFGTGYSSLSYLMSFPFDKIKIDRSFLNSDDKSATKLTLIRTIINLAKNLGMRTTAEGVETLEHLEFLKKEGCDEIQGFLISQPIPPEAIEAGEDNRYLNEKFLRKIA